MGCITSKDTESGKSRQIDKELKKARQKDYRLARLLLLGAGECGKSTIVKQMKLIHGNGYSDSEKAEFSNIIFQNVTDSLISLINAMTLLGIKYDSDSNMATAGHLLESLRMGNPSMIKELNTEISVLWADSGVQSCYERRGEYYLMDSAAYFISNMNFYIQPDFVPRNQDIVQTRVKTTGIIETEFVCKGLTIKLIDVGGQRSERKKWINCFEDVHAILFIASLADYNLVVEEDNVTNRLNESIKLFESIKNNPFFTNTAIILFLNKKDIFIQKLRNKQFSDYFPYTGPNDYDNVSARIKKMFIGDGSSKIYTHLTNATNTENVRVVFDAVIDIVANANLKEVGLS